MASRNNQTDVGSQDDRDVPVAMIVCLGVGAYLFAVIFIIVIYRAFKNQGPCHCADCSCEGCGSCCHRGSGKSCSCGFCSRSGQACSCCNNCNLNCFSRLCGESSCCKQPLSCSSCCKGGKSDWPSCSSCCTSCSSMASCFPSCSCNCCDGEGCVCFCLEIKLHKGDTQGKPYSDEAGKELDGTVKQNGGFYDEGGGGDTGQLFSTHSPRHLYPMGVSSDKQQRLHQRRGLDGPGNTGVMSETERGGGGEGHLNSTPIHVKRFGNSVDSKAQVSFKQTNGEDCGTRRKLPPPPGEEDDSIGRDKNYSNMSSTELSNSDGSHRLSSRIRRSLHAGRRSQRYPDKFLVDAESSPSKAEPQKNVHKASSKVGSSDIGETKRPGSSHSHNSSKQGTQLGSTTSTRSTQLSLSTANGQTTAHFLSSGSSGHGTTQLLSSGANATPRRTLPVPKRIQAH